MTTEAKQHKHQCVRCGEEFDCRHPGEGQCTAGYKVLPIIVNADATGYEEHCPRPQVLDLRLTPDPDLGIKTLQCVGTKPAPDPET